MTPQETFVTRLRRHRQRNQISLEEIAAATRVKRELLEGLEGNDLTGWPHGLYARAWIRGYATVVGLDPNDTVDDFCRLFPQGDRRRRDTINEFAAIVGHPSEYKDEFPHADRRRRATDADGSQPSPQVENQPTEQWHALTSALRPLWTRLAALAPAQKSLRRGLP
jgi:transcriptional regulator with XRE-family HTH domain